jgi:hypothetical protein
MGTANKSYFIARTASIFLILLILNRFVQLFYMQGSSPSKAGGTGALKTPSTFNPKTAKSAGLGTMDPYYEPSGDQVDCSNMLDDREPIPNKIPLTIHQAYPHPDLPETLAKLQYTWKDHHFEWEYILWNERDMDDLIRFEYPWAFEMYNSASSFDQKVDFAKYFILLTVSCLWL